MPRLPPPQTSHIRPPPLWDCPKVAGRASTVKLGPKTDAAPKTHRLTPGIDAVTTDRILVISGCIDGVSCWGDIIADASKVKHIRGTIINGMSRDIDGSCDVGYPVYGRGVTMISARNRIVQVESGTPLKARGVTVNQDDYVIADNCGRVFVPVERIEEVLDLGERIDRRQTLMIRDVRAGKPVSEVMHDTQFEAVNKSTSSPATAPASPRNPKRASHKDEKLVALFADYNTPGVSDALDKLSICGQTFGIMPLTDYKKMTVGPAFTVRYVPASKPPGSVGDPIDNVAVGDGVVIDNGGRTDCTVWGDIMTEYAVCEALVALYDEYPLFTAGRWMQTSKDWVQVGGVNESIGIGKVHVQPRDIVVADANGVVIVPRDRAREVAEGARKIEKSKAAIRGLIAEARDQLGYHTQQRKA